MNKCTLAHDYKWETENLPEGWTNDIFRCSKCHKEPQHVKPNLLHRLRCFFTDHKLVRSDSCACTCQICGDGWWDDEIPFTITDIPRRLHNFWWDVRRVLNVHNWPALFHRCGDCGKRDRVLFLHIGKHDDCWDIPF